MRRLTIRLAILVAALLVVSQLAVPPYLEHRVANRLTEHGGNADVQLGAFPALSLVLGRGGKLDVKASGLSVDVDPTQEDVFTRLDDFDNVNIDVRNSRAGPFSIEAFRLQRVGTHSYAVAVAGEATAGDLARYAGDRLAGGFGRALAGLATSALIGFGRPVPFDAGMQVDTASGTPHARAVVGSVAGLPAGPLAQIVANALLGTI